MSSTPMAPDSEGADSRMPDGVARAEVPGITLVSELGNGGFGTVYLGKDTVIGREVAVKIDRRTLLDDSDKRRFTREVTAAGQVSAHPNIVTLLSGGITRTNRPYLVMELCPGGSLNSRLAESGAQPPADVVRVGIAIADALSAAHTVGILHRDVKPANILITAYGAPALADFGLASLPAEWEMVTMSQHALTPSFAAPESFERNAATPQADVFSLGATLYALLTGRPPRWTDTGSPSLFELLELSREPLPRLDIPGFPGLMDAIAHATDPDPARRSPTAAAVRDELMTVAKSVLPDDDVSRYAPVVGLSTSAATTAAIEAVPPRGTPAAGPIPEGAALPLTAVAAPQFPTAVVPPPSGTVVLPLSGQPLPSGPAPYGTKVLPQGLGPGSPPTRIEPNRAFFDGPVSNPAAGQLPVDSAPVIGPTPGNSWAPAVGSSAPVSSPKGPSSGYPGPASHGYSGPPPTGDSGPAPFGHSGPPPLGRSGPSFGFSQPLGTPDPASLLPPDPSRRSGIGTGPHGGSPAPPPRKSRKSRKGRIALISMGVAVLLGTGIWAAMTFLGGPDGPFETASDAQSQHNTGADSPDDPFEYEEHESRVPSIGTCWAGLTYVSGQAPTSLEIPCEEPHRWETFARGVLDPNTDYLMAEALQHDPQVIDTCTMVGLSAHTGETPPSTTVIHALGPTPTDGDLGYRGFSCIADYGISTP